MSAFVSGLAPHIESMLDYREALGYSRKSHEARLSGLDRYCVSNYPNADTLSKEMVLGWLEKQHSGVSSKAETARLLGKYLIAIGKDAYVLYDGYVSERKNPSAYLFSDDELSSLFAAVDKIKPTKNRFCPKSHPLCIVLFIHAVSDPMKAAS